MENNSMTLFHIASLILNRPLFLHPAKAEVILHVLQGRIGLGGAEIATLSPDASRFVGRRQGQDGAPRMYRLEGGVAILTIAGSLVNRGAWLETNSGLVSYEGITAQLRQAKLDTEAKAVVIDMDTPGGEATGMFSVAAVVAEVAKVKPVIVVVNDMAASAELCLNLGDAHHQAARFLVWLVTSTPSLNLIPSMTFGN